MTEMAEIACSETTSNDRELQEKEVPTKSTNSEVPSSSNQSDNPPTSNQSEIPSSSRKGGTSSFFKGDTPHGKAKRIIWKKFLQSYIPKILQAKRANAVGYKVLIYDVTAGEGLYGDEWPEEIEGYGSPLIAMRVAIDYFINTSNLLNQFNEKSSYDTTSTKRNCNFSVKLVFVEPKMVRHDKLVDNVKKMFWCYGIPISVQDEFISSENGQIQIECRIIKKRYDQIDIPEPSNDERMVTFIDPFGYKEFGAEKVARFVGEYKDVFLTLMTSYMKKSNSHEYQDIDEIVSCYVETIKRDAKAPPHVLSFEMRQTTDDPKYHLLFFTGHIEGVKSMKEAMNRVSMRGDEPLFSDFEFKRNELVWHLGNKQNEQDVANAIFKKYKGNTGVEISNIEVYVLKETPFVFRKKPLKILQKENRITNVVNQFGENPEKRGTFPDINQKLVEKYAHLKLTSPSEYKENIKNKWRLDFTNA